MENIREIKKTECRDIITLYYIVKPLCNRHAIIFRTLGDNWQSFLEPAKWQCADFCYSGLFFAGLDEDLKLLNLIFILR